MSAEKQQSVLSISLRFGTGAIECCTLVDIGTTTLFLHGSYNDIRDFARKILASAADQEMQREEPAVEVKA